MVYHRSFLYYWIVAGLFRGVFLGGFLKGRSAHELVQLYGKPRLQIVEGEGSKLQFAGPNCVLDVYLYPPSGGGTPRATLIEARNSQGNDVSAQSCAATIQQR